MSITKISMYEACLMHSRAERVLKSLVSKHLEKYNLTRMEWLLLATVNQPYEAKEGHTMGELAEKLDIRLSQVTALVVGLHDNSLVIQKIAKRDRRTRYVTITNRGLTNLEEIEATMRQAMREWLSGIPRDQLIIYLKTVRQLGYDI